MKKIFFLIMSFLLVLWWMNVFACSTTSSTYQTVNANRLNFKAWQKDWKVKMTWSNFTVPNWEKRHYRKVVRSSTNSNPVYPEDWYIKYEWNISFNSYTDSKPKKWTNYYRVCAITDKNWQRKRYCSNVVKINFEWNDDSKNKDENKNEKEYTNNYNNQNNYNYQLSNSMKLLLDKVIKDFFEKLDNKYWNNINWKITKLETLLKVMKNLKLKSDKTKAIFNYLQNKIEEQLGLYQAQQLLQL